MVPSMILLKIVSFWVVDLAADLAFSTSELRKLLAKKSFNREEIKQYFGCQYSNKFNPIPVFS